MGTWIWTTASGTWAVHAANEAEAYRKVIANRATPLIEDGMSLFGALRMSVRWFRHDDSLVEADGDLDETDGDL